MRLINAGRGGIVDEDALAAAIADGRLGGAAIDTFAKEPTTESPLFALDNVVVTPHLGASTVEAQDKAGETIAEQVVLALRGDFVPFAVNVAASEASESVRPFLPLAERVGRLFTGLAGGAPSTLQHRVRRRDRRLRLPRAHALGVERRARVRSSANRCRSSTRRRSPSNAGSRCARRSRRTRVDYVNLIVVRGDQGTHVAATLFGKQQAPRIVGIDGHQVDLPPARYMLVVHNDDSPGHDRQRRVRARRRRRQHLEHGTWVRARAVKRP